MNDLESKMLAKLRDKTWKHLNPNLGIDEAFARIAFPHAEVRIDMKYTEPELRVIAWALTQAMKSSAPA